MATTSVLSEQSVLKTQASVVAKTGVHLNYLDSIRAILITLVIALHTAIAYGAFGDWTYVDPAESEIAGILLTLVTGTIQAFSLGLYFFISGYFTPGSYDRKGIGQFWKDRLIKLGIPMIIYTLFLSRIPQYLAGRAMGMVSESFWKFSSKTFLTQADAGPTWFIFALFLFLIGYTIWRIVTRSSAPEKLSWIKKLNVPGKKQILAFGLVVALGMFAVGLFSTVGQTVEIFGTFKLMTIFFVQYILFFIVGILANRNDWINRFDGKDLRFWSWLTLGLFFVLPMLFVVVFFTSGTIDTLLGGFYWQSAVFMTWVGLFSVSISMMLILWLRDRKKQQSPVMAYAGPNSYGVYLIHPLILVPITVAFVPLAIHPLVKYAIVLPLVVVLCFLVSGLLRRIPGVKKVL
jgi:glucans biosynthesis protein C